MMVPFGTRDFARRTRNYLGNICWPPEVWLPQSRSRSGRRRGMSLDSALGHVLRGSPVGIYWRNRRVKR